MWGVAEWRRGIKNIWISLVRFRKSMVTLFLLIALLRLIKLLSLKVSRVFLDASFRFWKALIVTSIAENISAKWLEWQNALSFPARDVTLFGFVLQSQTNQFICQETAIAGYVSFLDQVRGKPEYFSSSEYKCNCCLHSATNTTVKFVLRKFVSVGLGKTAVFLAQLP